VAVFRHLTGLRRPSCWITSQSQSLNPKGKSSCLCLFNWLAGKWVSSYACLLFVLYTRMCNLHTNLPTYLCTYLRTYIRTYVPTYVSTYVRTNVPFYVCLTDWHAFWLFAFDWLSSKHINTARRVENQIRNETQERLSQLRFNSARQRQIKDPSKRKNSSRKCVSTQPEECQM